MKKKKKIIFSEEEFFALESDLSKVIQALRDVIKDPEYFMVHEIRDIAMHLVTKRVSGEEYKKVIS